VSILIHEKVKFLSKCLKATFETIIATF